MKAEGGAMRICVIGAGAMGSLYGGRLALAGYDVTLVDLWAAHVEAIASRGLRLDGVGGDLTIPVRATARAAEAAPADLAIVFVDANSTGDAARVAAEVLREGGAALTLQNGIGNVEALAAVLGRGRVLAGLSYHSAAVRGPGHVSHTHAGPTWVGELDGARTPRLAALEAALAAAGLGPAVVDDPIAHVWNKWVLNCAINPISAATGLRLGEIARTPEVDAFQDRVLDEVLAVLRAKGVRLPDPDPRATIKAHTRSKYNKPSMLQHVEAGKRTEIDALNGAAVRLGRALGVPTPYNEALVAIVKGVERHRRQAVHGPAPDYEALEREAKRELDDGAGR
jgi:2-dehydropantoate 2-reductase